MKAAMVWIMILAGSATGATCNTAAGWKLYRNEKLHFSVCSPPGWHALYRRDPMFDIINFPDRERQSGVVLSPTGAWIQASPGPSWHSIDAWVHDNLQGSVPMIDRWISNPTGVAHGCGMLREVVWVSKPDKTGYTVFYCKAGSKLYSVGLINWEGDPKQDQLRETTLEIAKSLRVW